MANGPICVHKATTVEQADIIVAWLAEQGVTATIPDRDSFGTFAFGATDTEDVQICVADEATAERARALLAEHQKGHPAPADAHGAMVEVACEECKEMCSYPAEQRGSVQECPHCGAYVDVPRK